MGCLVATACAVAGLHLQLIPRGLTKLSQEYVSGGVGAYTLPCPGAFGSKVQQHGINGAAPTCPSLQVEPGVGGVDVGKQGLVLVELWFCKMGKAMFYVSWVRYCVFNMNRLYT